MKVETKKEIQNPLKKIKTIHKATISQDDVNLIMDILAKLYTHPETAVVREYVANAVDAHIKANVKVPVEVTLPTPDTPTLTVKDYGEGLDMHDILAIYGNFGVSDKRNSNDFIGGFGIGSKSGLAVSDKIYVESIKDGLKNIFELKRTSEGVITEFLAENVPAQGMKSGTTITVNYNKRITVQDMERFVNVLAGWSKNNVIATYQYDSLSNMAMLNKIVNLRIPDTWTDIGPAYVENTINIRHSDTKFVYPDIYDYNHLTDHIYKPITYFGQHRKHLAIVGNVAYFLDIDMNSIEKDINKELIKENKEPVPHDIIWQPLVLKFNIGDIKLPYSREYIDIKDNIKVIANAYYETFKKIKNIVNDIKKLDLPISEYLKKVHNEGIVLLNSQYILSNNETLQGIVMNYLPSNLKGKIPYEHTHGLNNYFINSKLSYNYIELYTKDLGKDTLKPIKLLPSDMYLHLNILNSILFINDIGNISETKLRSIIRSALTSKKPYKNNDSFSNIIESVLDKAQITDYQKSIYIVPKFACDEYDIKSFYYTVNLSDLLAYTHISTKTRKKSVKTNYIEEDVVTTTNEWKNKVSNISKIYPNKKKDATPIIDRLKEQKVLLFKPEQKSLFYMLGSYFIDLNIFDICIYPNDEPYNFLKDNLPDAKIFDENMLKDIYTTFLEGRWMYNSVINKVYDRNLLVSNTSYKNDISTVINEFDEYDIEPVLIPQNEHLRIFYIVKNLSPTKLKGYVYDIEELAKTDEFCRNALSGIDTSKYDVKIKEPSMNSRLFQLVIIDSYWAKNTLIKDDIIELYKNFKAEYKDELKLAREFYRKFL